MKTEEEILNEIKRMINRILNERLTKKEVVSINEWVNCLRWVLEE